MPADQQDESRLSRCMNDRRLDLGLRWEQVADGARLSVAGLRRLRTTGSVPRELTQRGLERVLLWAPGSVRRVIEGGEPEVLSGSVPVLTPEQKKAIAEAFLEAVDRTVAGQQQAV